LEAARTEVARQRSDQVQDLPPGFVPRLRSGQHLARAYYVYQGPDGKAHDTKAKAWAHHAKLMRDLPRSRSDTDLAAAAREARGAPSVAETVAHTPPPAIAPASAECASSPAATPSRRSKSPARRGRSAVTVPPKSQMRKQSRELRGLIESTARLETTSGH